jgi:predicted HAD superfamily Cof-like phosphohydrolase
MGFGARAALDMCEFLEKFKLAYYGEPRKLDAALLNSRAEHMGEEIREYQVALQKDDRVTQLDALVDLAYIACGTFILHGFIAFERAWESQNTKNLITKIEDVRPTIITLMPRSVMMQVLVSAYRSTCEWPAIQHELLVALFDIAYITADECEMQFEYAWSAVHRANMQKVLGEDDGIRLGIIKPEDWEPPDLSLFV